MKIKIDKLVFGGQGMGRLDDGRVKSADADHAAGRVCFVWNALPGEEVEVELTKNKKDFAEGVAKRIILKSPERQEPREAHYLSCSPWQILSLAEEIKWKVEMAKEIYEKFAGLKWDLELINDEKSYGYRNKMEFSFTLDSKGEVSLAFFDRGLKSRQAITGCELADPLINQVAKNILAWIRENKIPIRSLKAMIVRSNSQGQVIAALFIKDKLEFSIYPELNEQFVGFQLYYSTHKSPASVPTALLHSIGQNYLITELNGVKLKFGLLSFFQIHVPIFQKALADIQTFINKGDQVVDFYSGVGAIGLSLSGVNQDLSLELVESNQEAMEYAEENIKINRFNNTKAYCQPAEKMLDLIANDKVIIFDPPRAGLHQDIIDRVLEVLPEWIIYLSCNPSTQARDIKLLSGKYKVKFLKLYNFFPRTPHVEALCVLEVI